MPQNLDAQHLRIQDRIAELGRLAKRHIDYREYDQARGVLHTIMILEDRAEILGLMTDD